MVTGDILREAEDVLSRSKFGLRPEHALEIIALFKDTFEIVIPSLRVQAIQSDPENNTHLSGWTRVTTPYCK
jgi:predicted nucleic acid-binding protein